MEKRGERKEGVPVLALAKCLLASYVLTLLLFFFFFFGTFIV